MKRIALGLAALALCGGGAVNAAEKYHLVNLTSSPIDDSGVMLWIVCVDPDVAKKIMVNGKYGRKIWTVPAVASSERQAAEAMPFYGSPTLVSADCLEQFVATFKGFYPQHKLQVHDITYP